MIGLAPPELGENSSVCSGLHLGSGFISAIINAAIGPLLLLLWSLGSFVAGGGWRRSWGGNWGKTLVADGWQGPAFAGVLESRPLGGRHGNVELSSALGTGRRVGVA